MPYDLPGVGMLEWQDEGRCKETDPEAFFPEKGESSVEAKRICRGCEVRDKCLEWAIKNDEEFGVWGGMARDARRYFKQRGIEPSKFNIDAYLDAETKNRHHSYANRRYYNRSS